MSKTIDVRPGDTWTMWPGDPGMYQYRNEKYRYIGDAHVSWEWGSLKKDAVEVYIPDCAAKAILASWGYTLTAPDEKPNPSVCPDCQLTLSAPACNGEHQRKWDEIQASRGDLASDANARLGNARMHEASASVIQAVVEAKPAAVPVVDAVWVEHGNCLSGYSQWNKMHAMHGYEIRNGTARIVRIRSVDEQARRGIDSLTNYVESALNEVENRLAALEKPADKPAARVVKLPEGWWWERAWNQRKQNLEWIAWNSRTPDRMRVVVDDTGDETADRLSLAKAALAAAGVEYKESKDE